MGAAGSLLESESKVTLPFGVRVHGAKGLRDADWVPGTGSSDPYCVCRIGSIGSTWAEKALASACMQWTSITIDNNSDPEWNLTFVVDLDDDWIQIACLGQKGGKTGLELELMVYDDDVGTDELLGGTKIEMPVHSLDAAEPGPVSAPLAGVAGAKGLVTVSFFKPKENPSGVYPVENGEEGGGYSADEVVTTFLNKAYASGEIGMSALGAKLAEVSSLREGKDPRAAGVGFFLNSAQLAINADFQGLSKDGGKTVVDFPEKGTTMYLDHGMVVDHMKRMPALYGSGEMVKGNDLGFHRLNSLMWEGEKEPALIGLAAPVEQHTMFRPLMEEILGPKGEWNQQSVSEATEAYFQEFIDSGSPFDTSMDAMIFVCIFLHKLLFGYDMTRAEARIHATNGLLFLVNCGPPKEAMTPSIKKLLKHNKVKAYFADWRERMIKCFATKHPNKLAPEHIPNFVSAMQDALTFAGIPGGSSVLTSGLNLLYSCDSPFKERNEMTEAMVPQFTMEAMRLRAPVNGFAFYKDNTWQERHLALIEQASIDPRVWGEDALEFKLRDMATYMKLSVNHANFAVDTENPANNRFCPAKDLSFMLAHEWFKSFLKRRSKFNLPLGEKLEGTSSFTLHTPYRNADLAPPEGLNDADDKDFLPPPIMTLSMLHPKNIAKMMSLDISKCKDPEAKPMWEVFNRIETATKLNYKIMLKTVGLQKEYTQAAGGFISMDRVALPKKKAKLGKRTLAIGKRWVPETDEDETPPSLPFNPLPIAMAVFRMMKMDEKPFYFENDAQAELYKKVMFGSGALPLPSSEFKDPTADNFLSKLCFFGIAQQLLQRYDDDSGAELYAVDTTELAGLPLRDGYEKYGARAVFNDKRELLSVYTSAADKTYTPADAASCPEEWEHAKWVFKCSTFLHITADAHLVQTHWTIANVATIAVRSQLHHDHPIRRVLKVFTFGTASVNNGSSYILREKKATLHRLTGLTFKGLTAVLELCATRHKFKTLPQMVEEKRLGEGVKAVVPISSEGLELWALYHEFFTAYVGAFFENDVAVLADEELREFWTCIDRCGGDEVDGDYGLPSLSVASLIDYCTHVAYSVTAQHELVGGVAPYIAHNCASTSIRPGKNEMDVNVMTAIGVLTAFTGFRNPNIMDDWRHLLPLEPAAVRDTMWKGLMDGMGKLAESIEVKNASREQPCNCFNPKYLECSVSV